MGNKVIRRIREDNLISGGIMYKSEVLPGRSKPSEVPIGKYGLPVFPHSFQGKRVPWDEDKRIWDVGEEFKKDPEKLNELVAKAALKYPEGHSRQGEIIEEARLNDPEDHFFNHKEFNLWMDEGVKDMSSSNPIDQIILSNIQIRMEVSRMGEREAEYIGVGTKYEIVDKDYDKKIKVEKTNRQIDAAALIFNSDETKKRKLARMVFDTDLSKDMKEEDINDYLYTRIQESSKIRDEFREASKLPNDELDMKYYITMGLDKRVRAIRYSPSKKEYIFNGETSIGRNREDVFEFLEDSENYTMYETLVEIVENKLPL